MLPILQIGPLAVQLPGLILLAGMWFGLTMAEKSAPRHGVNPSEINNLVFYALIGGIVGARLAYSLRFASVYLRDPLSLVALNPNTLALPEGVLVGLIVAAVYFSRRDLSVWPTLDVLTPGLALFAAALALAHLSSGDAFGGVSDLPWAIELWGAPRHPTQAYELLLALGVLAVVVRLDQRRPKVPGQLILLWSGLAALSNLFLGAFRGDSVLVFEIIRRGQLIAVAVLAASLILMRARAVAGSGVRE